MDEQKEQLFIGVDISDAWTQISYYRAGMEEPETVSTIAGEERYRIPTSLCRKKGIGQWYLKDSSRHSMTREESICVDNLLSKCLKEETVEAQAQYQGRELLLLFLRKVIRLVPGVSEISRIAGICFHLEEVDYHRVKVFGSIMEEMGVEKGRVFLQDSKESFCHFAMNQKNELNSHDMILFQCEADRVKLQLLCQVRRKKPVVIRIVDQELGELPAEGEQRDEAFSKLAEETMRGKIISAVYLIGDGFEGGWLNAAVRTLCRGRRAFQGKNLYTKGACYEAFQNARGGIPYVYLSDNQLKKNIFLQVIHNGQAQFHSLVDAGASRFELHGECQVLLDGEPLVDIWLQEPESEEARIESLELTDLPKRPDRATRLSIEVLPSESGQVMVRVTDLGFGPWFEASGKVWEYNIDE